LQGWTDQPEPLRLRQPGGPYGNTLWYYAADVDNNTHGWINDYYLTTPGTATAPQPQTGHC